MQLKDSQNVRVWFGIKQFLKEVTHAQDQSIVLPSKCVGFASRSLLAKIFSFEQIQELRALLGIKSHLNLSHFSNQ